MKMQSNRYFHTSSVLSVPNTNELPIENPEDNISLTDEDILQLKSNLDNILAESNKSVKDFYSEEEILSNSSSTFEEAFPNYSSHSDKKIRDVINSDNESSISPETSPAHGILKSFFDDPDNFLKNFKDK